MVKPEINISRAGPGDAQLVSDLSIVTYIETYRGSCPDHDLTAFIDRCFNEKVITEELKDPDDLYYIAFADGFPAGYIRIKEDENEYPLEVKHKALEVKRIYVLKEFHSKKIGAALMSYALELAAENNYKLLWLGVWEENERAKLFYEKLGFTDINQTYTFYVGNTAQTDRWLVKFI